MVVEEFGGCGHCGGVSPAGGREGVLYGTE
jgi:hypothetical protein